MSDRAFGIETLCLHAGQIPDPVTGSRGRADLPDDFLCLRYGGSRREPVQPANVRQRLLAHQQSDCSRPRGTRCRAGKRRAALATASGMSAQMTAILAIVQPASTSSLVAALRRHVSQFDVTLRKMGIETTFVDPDQPEQFRSALRDSTRLLYAETLGNPRSTCSTSSRLRTSHTARACR